jgi:hypothetical protein
MPKSSLAVLVMFLMLLALWPSESPAGSSKDDAEEIGVSLVRLLALPEHYDGALVDVTGYLDDRGLLFLTEDHAEVFDIETAIRFVDPTKDGEILQHCVGSYARIVGTFGIRKEGPVRKGDPSFYIISRLRRVTTIKKGPESTVCWRAPGTK